MSKFNIKDHIDAILQTIQSGIVIIKADEHKIIYVNDYAAKLIGRPANEIIGEICHKFICPADIGKCPVTDLGKEIDSSKRTLLQGAECGGSLPILKTVKSVELEGHKYLVEFFVDLSEQQRLENRLKETDINEAVLAIVAGISHHFNNINSVIGGAVALSKSVTVGGETGYLISKKNAEILQNAITKATGLILKLQNYSEKRKLYLHKTNLNLLLENVAATLRNHQNFNPTRTQIFHKGETGCFACVDGFKLEEALSNIALNALEAVEDKPDGEITFEIKEYKAISNPHLENGDYWQISVIDNGKGIEDTDLKQILLPFFTTRDPKRAGMGLKIADKIVKRNNGYLEIQSVPQNGTSVNIFLLKVN